MTTWRGCGALSVCLAGILLAQAHRQEATLAGRVVDAETGRVIPCSVTIRTSDGSLVTERPNYKPGFRSNGLFEKTLPAGKTTITVRRGFDYGAVTREVILKAGERSEVSFELHRRTPLRALGWYTGDSHIHMIHDEPDLPVDFPYTALAGEAEGLDHISVAQGWPVAHPTALKVQRECDRVSTPDFHMMWNMEAPKNYWLGDVSHCMGHGWFVGARTETSDGKDAFTELDAMNAHDYEREKTPAPNFESQALIHDLGGTVVYSHPCRWSFGKWGGERGYPVEEHKFISNMAAELPFDTMAGPTYDAIDILMQTHERAANAKAERLWYMLLNHGYRVAGTASSDANFNVAGRGMPGAVRVCTKIDGDFTPQGWRRR